MKKLLSLLSVLTISGSAVPTTIAASPYKKEEKLNSDINYSQTNNLFHSNREEYYRRILGAFLLDYNLNTIENNDSNTILSEFIKLNQEIVSSIINISLNNNLNLRLIVRRNSITYNTARIYWNINESLESFDYIVNFNIQSNRDLIQESLNEQNHDSIIQNSNNLIIVISSGEREAANLILQEINNDNISNQSLLVKKISNNKNYLFSYVDKNKKRKTFLKQNKKRKKSNLCNMYSINNNNGFHLGNIKNTDSKTILEKFIKEVKSKLKNQGIPAELLTESNLYVIPNSITGNSAIITINYNAWSYGSNLSFRYRGGVLVRFNVDQETYIPQIDLEEAGPSGISNSIIKDSEDQKNINKIKQYNNHYFELGTIENNSRNSIIKKLKEFILKKFNLSIHSELIGIEYIEDNLAAIFINNVHPNININFFVDFNTEVITIQNILNFIDIVDLSTLPEHNKENRSQIILERLIELNPNLNLINLERLSIVEITNNNATISMNNRSSDYYGSFQVNFSLNENSGALNIDRQNLNNNNDNNQPPNDGNNLYSSDTHNLNKIKIINKYNSLSKEKKQQKLNEINQHYQSLPENKQKAFKDKLTVIGTSAIGAGISAAGAKITISGSAASVSSTGSTGEAIEMTPLLSEGLTAAETLLAAEGTAVVATEGAVIGAEASTAAALAAETLGLSLVIGGLAIAGTAIIWWLSSHNNNSQAVKHELHNQYNEIEKYYKFLAHDQLKLDININEWNKIKQIYQENANNYQEFKNKIKSEITNFHKEDHSGWGGSITDDDINTLIKIIYNHFQEINNHFLSNHNHGWKIITNTIGWYFMIEEE